MCALGNCLALSVVRFLAWVAMIWSATRLGLRANHQRSREGSSHRRHGATMTGPTDHDCQRASSFSNKEHNATSDPSLTERGASLTESVLTHGAWFHLPGLEGPSKDTREAGTMRPTTTMKASDLLCSQGALHSTIRLLSLQADAPSRSHDELVMDRRCEMRYHRRPSRDPRFPVSNPALPASLYFAPTASAETPVYSWWVATAPEARAAGATGGGGHGSVRSSAEPCRSGAETAKRQPTSPPAVHYLEDPSRGRRMRANDQRGVAQSRHIFSDGGADNQHVLPHKMRLSMRWAAPAGAHTPCRGGNDCGRQGTRVEGVPVVVPPSCEGAADLAGARCRGPRQANRLDTACIGNKEAPWTLWHRPRTDEARR